MAKLPARLRRGIRLLDVHTHSGIEPLGYLSHGFPFCLSLRESREQNLRIGTTHAVVFPFCTTLYYHLPSLQQVKIKLGGRSGQAPFHFENEHLLRQLYDLFPDYTRMFIPFAIVDTLRETRAAGAKCLSFADRALSLLRAESAPPHDPGADLDAGPRGPAHPRIRPGPRPADPFPRRLPRLARPLLPDIPNHRSGPGQSRHEVLRRALLRLPPEDLSRNASRRAISGWTPPPCASGATWW